MTPQLQQLVAGGLVFAAVAYLLWRWRRRSTAPTCDGCHADALPRTSRGIRSRSLVVLRDR